MFKTIKPNWFASVMGTGIVANAAMLLPIHDGLLTAVATSFWIAAAVLLVVLLLAAAGHFAWHRELARSHHHELAIAPFYGAVSMALLTVGSGTLLVASNLLGTHAATTVDAVLWTLGTASGLWCAVSLPYLLFTEHRPKLADVNGSWLMPVVPPMVSAATGAGLIAHLAAGQARLDLLLGCYAMFGLSLMMAVIVIAILWARLAVHGVGEARLVPTLWIVLGPLGQSVTAVALLAHAAAKSVPQVPAGSLHAFALVYGVAIWGFAISWLALAALVTLKTARERLPFSPTWWSFTFPLGTVVTGTSQLTLITGVDALKYVAVALYAGLLTAWVTVALGTLRTYAMPTPRALVGPARG